MRVAIIANPYVPVPPQKYGGIEQVIHHLIKGLMEEGHEPILFGTGDSNVPCKLVPVVDKAIGFMQDSKELREHQKLLAKIDRSTATELRKALPGIDIIHSHGFDLKVFADFPNVTTLHNTIEMEALPFYEERKDLNYVSISKNQQESYPELNYVGVAYNGEDPNAFPVVEKPGNYVCFLGRFDRDKNPHIAIQLAINYGIKIKLAGKIDHKSNGYFEEEVAPYLDHPLVTYLGELGFKDKVKLLSKAKCNLHPTGFREPFGLTVVEAAYCGTPTLAIARGAMSEVIEEDRTGMLVEDFVEGFHLVQRCFEMDRNYISSRARMLFNYQTMTKQYLHAYNQVLENR
jgi:glycosyltransferase involved in cell wall biosynthesis